MKYSDGQRVNKIIDYAQKLLEYIEKENISKDDLKKEYSLQWLVTTPLYNIGENAYYLSAEYKEKYNTVPWAMISGLRHRLVHDYDGTNWNIIADVVFDELPELISQLKDII